MLLEDLVSDYAKGIVIALGPEDGESFWQPLPSTGYVINKINPYNSPYDAFSTGLQVLEPGAHIRRHAHERSHELLFCYRGTGQADIDGKLYDVLPETMILRTPARARCVYSGSSRRRVWRIGSAPSGGRGVRANHFRRRSIARSMSK